MSPVLAGVVALLLAGSAGAADIELSEPTRRLVGMAEAGSLTNRTEALAKLQSPLSKADEDSLLALINDRSRCTSLPPEGEAFFINELLNTLRRLHVDDNRLGGELVVLYRDPERSALLHDYALQHMAAVYAASGRGEQLLGILFSALEEREATLAGTALRLLLRISLGNAAVDRAALGEAAQRIAGDERYDITARSAAVQVCGALNRDEALPLVRTLAGSESTHRILRIAALNALGKLGNGEDIALLARTAEEGAFYAPAAKKGRQQLLDKLASSTEPGRKGSDL